MNTVIIDRRLSNLENKVAELERKLQKLMEDLKTDE